MQVPAKTPRAPVKPPSAPLISHTSLPVLLQQTARLAVPLLEMLVTREPGLSPDGTPEGLQPTPLSCWDSFLPAQCAKLYYKKAVPYTTIHSCIYGLSSSREWKLHESLIGACAAPDREFLLGRSREV